MNDIKSPEDFNLLDPDVIENPYEAYEFFRNNSPVYLSPHTGFYVVTKYEDLKRVLTDFDFFSRDIGAYWEKSEDNKKRVAELKGERDRLKDSLWT